MTWYADYVDDSGLVADASEWNLVDWSATFLDGRSALINGLFALALGEYARMSADVGNAADATWARELLAGVKAGFEDLWDPQRCCYVDHVDGSGDARAASQLANALPLLAGIVPEDRTEDVVRLLTDTEHLVVRSWIGANGVYDEQLIIDNIHGVQRVTWDTETEHVRAEPFASALVHEALAAAGRTDAVVDDMRRWSEFLADGYDTFGECWGWGTPCHGWSSCPTSDLVRHVLGVRPEQPGFARAVVAPRPDLASGLHGSAPTPAGPITVSCTADAVRVTSPVPFTFITPSGSASRHDAGEYVLPLQV
nr:hypothetical protein [Actinomyces sp. Z16]